MTNQNIEKIPFTSSKSDIWKAYKEAISSLEDKNITSPHISIQPVTKANSALKGFLSKQKLQIVSQLDTSLSELAGEFDRAEEMLIELKQSAVKRRKQLEEESTQIQKQKTREQEEYTYEFNRRKQRQETELQEQKKTTDAEITLGKTELKKQQGELADLRKQVEMFDARLATEIKKTKEETEKELKNQHEHERALGSQKYESQQILLQQKIDSLMDVVKSQQQEVGRLNKILIDANAQVTSIAEKAVSQKYITQPSATERAGGA
jgi:chromosome segregation ATPase